MLILLKVKAQGKRPSGILWLMPRRSDSRSRMIETAFELFRRQGFRGTPFSQLVAESGAPSGSIHYLFPGGKEELAVATAVLAVEEVDRIVVAASAEAHDAGAFVRAMAEIVGRRLEESGYQAGCSIATMVLELTPQVEELRIAFDRAFDHTRGVLGAQFERYGYGPARAAALAAQQLSILEGSLVIARAARSLEPLHTAVEAFVATLEPVRKSSKPSDSVSEPPDRVLSKPKRSAAPADAFSAEGTAEQVDARSAAIFDLLGRRWAMRLLWELRDGRVGFRALQGRCGVSSSILGNRLRELAAAALVDSEGGTRYGLTPLGRELVMAMRPLVRWAAAWEGGMTAIDDGHQVEPELDSSRHP